MKAQRLENWLRQVFSTQEHEISCSECFDSVSGFVDMEMDGADPALNMPEVRQHLSQCPACRDEYEVLRDLRRLEDENRAPSVDELRSLLG